ncbi:MAG: acetate--CoA ligase family protein [Proteobacteria bacterium]|nr:acetate--CoA ligase family protein [Pseudomonadota bacterium]
MSGRDFLSLDALFSPQSVAVLGASSDAGKIGGRPIKFLKAHGYAGRIYPVNPKAAEVQGLPAYADIGAVPDAVDHAIIALPGNAVIAAVEACISRGVRSATIFSSGFGEVGDAGRREQDRLSALARESGMRILGPNCMGFMNLHQGFIASFAFMVDLGLPPLGRIALVSQSGAFGGQALVMAKDKRVPLGAWVTTGNECDVELADCIAHFAQDAGTDVIMGYMEGCKSADKLVAALELARDHGKAVIMVKAGGSELGRQAVQSHTGALAGNDRVFDAIFRQYGVHRARSVEAFFDAAYAASGGRFPREGKLGVFTVSGGIGVLTADAAEPAGLQLPALPEATQRELKELLPHASVRNPVDGTAQIWSDWQVFGTFLRNMARDGDFEAMLLFLTAMPFSPALQQPLAALLKELRSEFPDKLLILSMLAPPELSRELGDAGYLLFEDTTRAVNALAALKELGAARERAAAKRLAARAAPPAQDWPALGTARNEHELKRLLSRCGIRVADEHLVPDVQAALAAAREIGFPVVMKIASPDILHKSDVGGVALDIADEAALEREWHRMMAQVRAAQPAARIDGVLVAPMLSGGVEMIVGVTRDPVFGPVAMVGLGGVFAELFGDVALRLAPVRHEDALEMVRELKGFALLDGARGRPKADVDALADAIVRLSGFAAANAGEIESIEINPMLVMSEGAGAFALDAAVVTRNPG